MEENIDPKYISKLDKPALFSLMLELDPREIRIVCYSKNKKVRDVCNSKAFQKAYWDKHRKKLMEGKIKYVSFERGDSINLFFVDEKNNNLHVEIDKNNKKIKRISYIAELETIGNINILFLTKASGEYTLGALKTHYDPQDPESKKFISSIHREDWFDDDRFANEKGIKEFISEVKDVLKDFDYKGKNLSEIVKF